MTRSMRLTAVLVLAGCLAATAAFAAAKPLPQIVVVGGEPLQGFRLGSGHLV